MQSSRHPCEDIFGEASAWPTQSFVRKFRDDLKADCKADLAGKIVNEETLVAAAGLTV